MDLREVGLFVSEPCSNESDALMIPVDLLEPTPPGKYDFADGFVAAGIPAEGGFLDSILFPGVGAVPDDPMITMTDSGFGESLFSPSAMRSPASDFLESAPASPFSSPTSSSSSSSESGIEDDSDMEDQVPTPPEYDVACSVAASMTTETLCSPSDSSTCTSSAAETVAQARKLSDEHTSSVVEAQQELKKLLKQLIASPGLEQASSPPQTPLVPVYSLSTTSTESVLTTSMSSSPGAVMTNTPVTLQSSQGMTLTQSQSVVDPVLTLASVLTQNVPGIGDQQGKVVVQGHSKDRGIRTEPKLVLVEEPEENYRARYESERCRGPIHGSKDSTFPTVQVVGYSGPVWITIHLITSAGIPHYHSIRGPGSTKVPCKEFTLPGGVPAVQVMVASDSNMTAILDSLSIRRLRNWEGDRELRKRQIDPRTWKRERKEARLMFRAEIPQENGQSPLTLTCKSRIFQCSSYGASGNPEILWASLSEGSVTGSDELGLIGKKFQSGFKVRFYACLPSGDIWEQFGEIDKSKSHQGAAVLSTPAYCDLDITSPVTVNIEVITGSNRDPKCSEPIEFTYKPQVKVEPVQNLVTCQGLILQQDSNKLGGLITTVKGGTNGMTVNGDFSAVGNLLLINQALELPEMATATPVVTASQLQPDQQDWQALAVQLKAFYQKGALTTQHIKALCLCIERRDTLLLQAFRSARNAVSQDEFEMKFKQYLSGMLSSVPL